MDLKLVRYFQTIAAVGSFSRAAEQLNISQPALSQAIKSLERDLHCTLFHRDRQISLTPEGERLHARCLPLFHLVEDIENDIGLTHTGTRGTVRGAMLESVLLYLLPDVISKFVGEYPEVQFRLSKFDSPGIEQAVGEGEAHFGLTSRPPLTRKVQAVKLRSFDHALFGPKPSRGKAPNAQESLKRYPLLLLDRWQHELLRRKASDQLSIADAKIHTPINCVVVLRQLVVRALGCAVLPVYVDGPDLHLIQRLKRMPMDLYLLRPRSGATLKAADRFIDALTASLKAV